MRQSRQGRQGAARVNLLTPNFVDQLERRLMFATVPAGFVDTQLKSGLNSPTALDVAPDGRVFIATQEGKILILKNDSQLITFTTLPTDSMSERGMLGITLDPNFATNNYVYAYYTATTPASHNRVIRLTANGDALLVGSEFTVFDLPNVPAATNWHMGGAIHFGPDGKLYVAVGQHEDTSTPQSLNSVFGKILRINADAYNSIPTDNPFYTQTTGINRAIWARGLRNPYTFAVQPGTGKIFINDVGQDSWEEIDQGAAGANYGWPATEGTTSNPSYVTPFYAYPHNNGDGAITGGTFYNPPTNQFPAQYVGKYFFVDFNTGWMKTIDPTTKAVANFATGISFPTDMDVASDGSVYHLSRGIGTGVPGAGTGAIWKIRYTASTGPSISVPPSDQIVAVGTPATFSVVASGTAPLTYVWKKNNQTITGATSATYTTPNTVLADTNATFTCTVSNATSSVTTTAAKLTVVNGTAPIVQIDAPPDGSFYTAGDQIAYSGSASDDEGPLPASAFTWEVVFHHAEHTHPFLPQFSGVTSGTFTTSQSGHVESNVWYRIHLTVTDSSGLSTHIYRDVLPRTATITLATNPPGLALNLEGQPQTTPANVLSVVGTIRNLGAPLTQTVGAVNYAFVGWSDGGAATHDLTSPLNNTTYTATYQAQATTYVSDMPYAIVSNGWGPVEKDKSNGEDGANDGLPIKLNTTTYTKGLGAHAASEINVNLAKSYTTFLTDYGIDDEVGNDGSAIFQVFLDGVKKQESTVMTGASATGSFAIDVTGVSQLKLVITNGGDDFDFDHGDWANARLTNGGTPPLPPAPPPPPPPPPPGVIFSAPTGYATGTNAHGVRAVDVNADNKLDLLVADAGSDNVVVLLGNGNGTFTNKATYSVGSTPKMVATGDFNGDSKIDFATPNQDSNNISIRLGNGDGTFGAATTMAAVAGSHELTVADLNGDGKLDIADAGWGATSIGVFIGNGNGTFAAMKTYASGNEPHSIVAVDFTGDNRPDLVVANLMSNAVAFLKNSGTGTFAAPVSYAVGAEPHSIRVADLNGDTKLDFVTANEDSNNVSVRFGNGDGTFGAVTNFATGLVPKGVAIGDVNGDARPDILTANTAGNYPDSNNPGGNQISVLLGNGAGSFAAPVNYTTGRTPFSIALGDFDGDGDLDAATANWHTNNATVLINQTAGQPVDNTPPALVSGPSATPSQTGATIAWGTDEASSTQIEYGTTIGYGSSTTLNTSLVTSHSQQISNLLAGTQYHYHVLSRDAAGNLLTSADFTFTTTPAPVDMTPPSLTSGPTATPAQNAATIAWGTNEASSTQIQYGTTIGYGSSTTLNTSLVTSHSQQLSNLLAGTQYHYHVLSRDAAGNLFTSGDFTFTTTAVDNTPPSLTSGPTPTPAQTTATIVWGTNEASSTQINYGTTIGYGSSTTLNTSLVTSHSQQLSSLLAGTQYHYQVLSRDAAGNLFASGDFTFTTTAGPTAPAAPSGLTATPVSTTQINLAWIDNSSNETGFKIERKTGAGGTYAQIATVGANVTTYNNTGLASGTTYYYRVRANNGTTLNSGYSNEQPATTQTPTNATLIPVGDTWKYLDNGSNQGTAWRATAFNDASWKSGKAQLGYGDGDEATVVSYGTNANQKYVTTYFRRAFTVADKSKISALAFRLKRDDGAVVYLNGTQVLRSNMPSGTGYTTLAAELVEDESWFPGTINTNLLVNGTNVIAIEVHQGGRDSSDVSFDFELTATMTASAASLASLPKSQAPALPAIKPQSASSLVDDAFVGPIRD